MFGGSEKHICPCTLKLHVWLFTIPWGVAPLLRTMKASLGVSGFSKTYSATAVFAHVETCCSDTAYFGMSPCFSHDTWACGRPTGSIVSANSKRSLILLQIITVMRYRQSLTLTSLIMEPKLNSLDISTRSRAFQTTKACPAQDCRCDLHWRCKFMTRLAVQFT